MNIYPTPWRLAAAAVLALSASAASAQTLPTPAPIKVYDGGTTPQLIGLDGVSVLGQQFDVRFIGGQSCAQTFSGCDSLDDLTFKTVEGATAASQALKGALSPSDTPRNVEDFHTPYTVSSTAYGRYPVLTETYKVIYGYQSLTSNSFTPTQELGPYERFAVWTPAVTAVPEPGTYALMLAGLGAVGFMARRRRSA